MGVPQNGWFIRKNPIKMDDLEVALFQETTIWIMAIYPTTRLLAIANYKSTINRSDGGIIYWENKETLDHYTIDSYRFIDIWRGFRAP